MPAPKKYDEETVARAVRMFRDRLAEGDVSQLAARQEVGELLGVNQSTLRNWIRREDSTVTRPAGGGGEEGETVEQQNARLRRENARLRRANEILKTSSAFFAAAELDRQLGNH
jgi:transposase